MLKNLFASLALLSGFLVTTPHHLAFAQNVNLRGACNRGAKVRLKTPDGFQVNLIRYGYQDAELSNKLIVIVPPTGGVNTIDRMYAELFCRHGYLAIIMESYTGSDEVSLDLAVHQRVIEKMPRAMRILRLKYDQGFFGILGTSAGAIIATTVVHDFKDDLDAIFTIVSGAPLHSVIARAGEKNLRKLRKQRMKKFGFQTIEEYEEALEKELHVEVPHNISPQIKVGMVLANKDETVPSIFQHVLLDWWRPHLHILLGRKHTGAILFSAARHRGQILQFFNSAVEERI